MTQPRSSLAALLASVGLLLVTAGPAGAVTTAGPDDIEYTVAGGGTGSPRGGLATNAGFGEICCVAASADGGFFVGTGDTVYRVSPSGTIAPAGVGGGQIAATPDGGYVVVSAVDVGGGITFVAGDGARHDVTTLPDGSPNVSGVAALGDGSVLVISSDSDKVFRVWPDGTGSEVPLRLSGLVGPIAALPDGRFVVSANRRSGPNAIYTAALDGTAHPLAAMNASALAAGPDGAVAAVTGHAVSRIAGDGSTATVLSRPGSQAQFFDVTGDPASRLPLSGSVYDVAISPDGTLLVVTQGSRGPSVRAVVPLGSSRLAVAFPKETLPALRRRIVRYRVTRAARVELDAFTTRRKHAAHVHAAAHAGVNTLRLSRKLGADVYGLKLTATAGPAAASDHLVAIVGGVLPVSVARDEVTAAQPRPFPHGADFTTVTYVDRCARMSATRVDCSWYSQDESIKALAGVTRRAERRDGCGQADGITAATLARDDVIHYREYGCARGFERSPRWSGRSHVGTPLG